MLFIIGFLLGALCIIGLEIAYQKCAGKSIIKKIKDKIAEKRD
jgi:hypothetical protein